MVRSNRYKTMLTGVVQNYLTRMNDPHINLFLRHWPEPGSATRDLKKSTLPVLTCLPEMTEVTAPDILQIVKLLQVAANDLAWGQTYSSEDFGATFLNRYGWTELIGTRGFIVSSRMACGFLLLGPEIEYPIHRHEAEEVYIPLTGPSFWKRNNNEWISREAGMPIYHDPWEPHAIRTDLVPLLAIYLWQGGDLAQKSLID